MPKTVADSVIVITGASTGVGRATALKCAQLGGTVVLVSRREHVLKRLASHCESFGARTLVVAADVANDQAMRSLAKRAVETFGRIDVWINNASVGLFARIEDAPLEEYRKVIETNLFGCIHGARAALPYFREQGSGTLINVSSVAGKIGSPYLSAYAASKFAVIGLSRSIRMETMDVPDIHICTVLPASLDTPFFQHAANYTGRAVKPTNPVYEADQVANAIVELITKPQREIIVGGSGKIASAINAIAPAFLEKSYAIQVEKDHFQNKPAPMTAGSVVAAQDDYETVSGGWKLPTMQPNTVAKRKGVWLGLAVASLGVLLMVNRNAVR